MAIPKKGSQVMAHRDKQYRWKARATANASEILCEYNEIPDGELLVIQLPKVCNLGLLEPGVDYALKNGWKPDKVGGRFVIRKNKDSFRVIEEA